MQADARGPGRTSSGATGCSRRCLAVLLEQLEPPFDGGDALGESGERGECQAAGGGATEQRGHFRSKLLVSDAYPCLGRNAASAAQRRLEHVERDELAGLELNAAREARVLPPFDCSHM